MSEVFLISDTHFGHRGIITFEATRPFRPFLNIEEHDEALIENWNRVVAQKDIVWHLGDFCFGSRNVQIAGRLNGKKRLVAGNHDVYPKADYLKYFEKIEGCHEFKGMLFSHMPCHVSQLKHRYYLNVHGHLHTEVVKREDGTSDNRYFNVSCERINLTPIYLDEVYNYWAETRG